MAQEIEELIVDPMPLKLGMLERQFKHAALLENGIIRFNQPQPSLLVFGPKMRSVATGLLLFFFVAAVLGVVLQVRAGTIDRSFAWVLLCFPFVVLLAAYGICPSFRFNQETNKLRSWHLGFYSETPLANVRAVQLCREGTYPSLSAFL